MTLLLPSPMIVSLKFEPRTRVTPARINPTEPSPDAVPAEGAIHRYAAAVALTYEIRVLPLPVMVSLPPIPSNSLKVVPIGRSSEAPLKPSRDVGIDEIGAADQFDRLQRIGSDRGVADHGTCRHVDGDAGDRPDIAIIDRLIEAAAAIDSVIAGSAIEELRRELGRSCCCRITYRQKPEPMMELTPPVIVSWPTEASPARRSEGRSTVTPAVALM